MPPPAAADVAVAQLTVELDELGVELGDELDEQPAASSTAAATPANANLYGDLTSAS
jgi:hypothetical protein